MHEVVFPSLYSRWHQMFKLFHKRSGHEPSITPSAWLVDRKVRGPCERNIQFIEFCCTAKKEHMGELTMKMGSGVIENSASVQTPSKMSRVVVAACSAVSEGRGKRGRIDEQRDQAQSTSPSQNSSSRAGTMSPACARTCQQKRAWNRVRRAARLRTSSSCSQAGYVD
jgi:hypothetical protein